MLCYKVFTHGDKTNIFKNDIKEVVYKESIYITALFAWG